MKLIDAQAFDLIEKECGKVFIIVQWTMVMQNK